MGRIERRKRETWLQFLWGLSDAVATIVAFVVAYWVRFHSPFTEIVPVTLGVPSLVPYATAGVLMALAWLPLFGALGLYQVDSAMGPIRRALRIAQAAGLAVILGAAITFFYRDFTFSRAFFPVLYLHLVVLLIAGRGLVRIVSRRWQRDRPLRVAIVGESPSGRALVERLHRTDPIGISLCGRFVRERGAGEERRGGTGAEVAETSAAGATLMAPPSATSVADERRLPVLGRYEDVAAVALEERLDVLILALALDEQADAAAIVTACRGLPVDIELVPDILQLLTRRARVREHDGLPVLSLREFPLTGWNAVRKRMFDLALSVSGLVLLAPLMVVLAMIVKLTSPGPVFYAQERLGRDGRRFWILKFRSMRVDAEAATGPVWAVRDDARRTPIGRFLREWSLDELPQLLNVVRGEMSLVGPRPERPHFVSQFSASMPDYVDRHRVKSGITGWAQVHGLRGDTSVEDRTRHDLYYVENWSLLLDAKILVMTVAEVLRRRDAY
jgi:Undecaprenyl-phosphate glucose phosphotransferase